MRPRATAYLAPRLSERRPAQRREINAAANWPPATTPTMRGPNPSTSCTCSGSTGSAMPMIMNDRKTTAMTGNADITDEARLVALLRVVNFSVKADIVRIALRGLSTTWSLLASAVFLVRDGFEPNHTASPFIIGDRDVIHLAVGRRTVPVLNVGRANDRLAFIDRFHRLSFFLIKPFAADDNESLSCRMCVPVASRTRFERHAADRIIIALCFLSEHLEIHFACKIIGWCRFPFRENAFAFGFCWFHFCFLRLLTAAREGRKECDCTEY